MRFYKVQINSLFLTSDGTNAGTPCKLSISNVEDLLTDVTGSLTPSASGEIVAQIVPFTAGKQFEIKIDTINKPQYYALKTLIDDSLDGSPLTVVGTGDTGDFTVSARPALPKPYSAERFINNRIIGVTLRLYTTA